MNTAPIVLGRPAASSPPSALLAALLWAGCAADGGKGGDTGPVGSGAPPTAPTILLSPAQPTADGDLRVVILADAWDPEGDAVRYTYAWAEDGEPRPELTGDTVPAAELRRGDRWRVTVTATDGASAGEPARALATVVNAPPRARVLLPATAGSGDTLIGAVEGFDADGDALRYSFAWERNGRPTDWTDLRVGSSATARGDVWVLIVTPRDGEVDGDPVSASLQVVNGPPTLSSADLGPEVVYEDTVLQATVSGLDDPDGDPAALSYTWRVNGAVVARALGDTLTGADFSKGDTVQVEVAAFDGLDRGPGVSSPTLTVRDAPPPRPDVAIAPAEPAAGEALLCEVDLPEADIDGDPLRLTIRWAVDGAPFYGTTTTHHPGDTVPARLTASGEAWTCAVDVTDGALLAPPAVRGRWIGGGCDDNGVVMHADAGLSFVPLCARSFEMGCTPGQAGCAYHEEPVRLTTLSRDIYVGRTEVTQAEFEALMGYNPSRHPGCGPDCPVEDISWHEALAFANAASAVAGLPACYTCSGSGASLRCTAPASVYSCAGYRLPTEAEWEAAARCGEDLRYAGSDVANEVAWTASNSGRRTWPVGSLAPNACGLYDMSGNVREWVNDGYRSSAYAVGSATDPTSDVSLSTRVSRGGSAAGSASEARVSHREAAYPTSADPEVGLRLVKTAD